MATNFDTFNSAVSAWADSNMGNPFTYAGGAVTLSGVFNQPSAEFSFDETGQRRLVDYVVVTDKAQWTANSIVPANRASISTDGVDYVIDAIDGLSATGEPAYTLYLRRLT